MESIHLHDEVLACRTSERVLLANSILVGMMNASEVILEQGRDLTHQDWHPHKKSEPRHRHACRNSSMVTKAWVGDDIFSSQKTHLATTRSRRGSLGQSSSQPLPEPVTRLPDTDFLPSRLKKDHFSLQHLLLFVTLCYKSPKTFIRGGESHVSRVTHDSDEPSM